MADQSRELIEHIKSHPPTSAFHPCARYGPEEDALMFYFRNDPDYAKRINSRVTVYLSMDDHEMVGCQIKGVKRVLDELGAVDITIKHGRVKLQIVLLALMDSLVEREETRSFYREVLRKAKETDVDLEIAEMATC